jgi:hypothetical protein
MLRRKQIVAVLLTTLTVGGLAGDAGARMKSTKLEPGLCVTSGGGRFVDIPRFPGEMIDRRLLRDIRWLRRHYPIFITDGYSTSSIHSANGEHPLGLALDIVPDRAAGGTWADIDALAEFAEPSQNAPVAPFRWVGYDGDANHGHGHHLHLSWSHSPATFGTPAETVYTMRCPKPRRARKGDGDEQKPPPPDGGTEAGEPLPSDPSGGVTPRLAPVAPETRGAGLASRL